MKKAVWIIAIAEVVRAMQNTVQLCMLVEERHRSREQQDKAFAVYEEAMNRKMKDGMKWCRIAHGDSYDRSRNKAFHSQAGEKKREHETQGKDHQDKQ